MTIEVTFNNVHSYADSSRRSHSNVNPLLLPSPTTGMKTRPFRKLQQYQSGRSDVDNYHNMYRSLYRYQYQPQILSNGYAVVPMLSLHDAALLNYKDLRGQQQQQQQQFSNRNTTYFHHDSEHHFVPNRVTSSFPPSSHTFDQSNVSMMFSSLTPSQHVNFVHNIDLAMSDESSSSKYSTSSSQQGSTVSIRARPSMDTMKTSQHKRTAPIRRRVTKKCVRFAPTATVKTIPVVSDEDVFNSWYQIDNYLAFESNNRQVVTTVNIAMKRYCCFKDLSKVSMKIKNKNLLKILQDDPTKQLQYEILGLEQFLFGPKHMLERRQETIHHSMTVLDMYNVQRTTKRYNPDVLRHVSERFSSQKVDRAIQRAFTTTTTTRTATMA